MKISHIFISAISLVFFCNLLEAQDNSGSNQRVLKLYLNGVYSNTKSSYTEVSLYNTYEFIKNEEYDFGGISFAIEMLTSKFFSHEFEIMPIKFDHNDDLIIRTYYYASGPGAEGTSVISGGKTSRIESTFRYQANHYFVKDKRTKPYIGLSTQLFFNSYKTIPAVSYGYLRSEQNLGLCFAITPGMSFNINDKLAIDFNIPFGLYEFKLNRVYHDNPRLPEEEKKTTIFLGEFAPKVYVFRLGIYYRI